MTVVVVVLCGAIGLVLCGLFLLAGILKMKMYPHFGYLCLVCVVGELVCGSG